MPSSRGLIIKLAIAVGVIVVGIYLIAIFTRPRAKVVAAYPGKAVNAVPGSVTVRAEFDMQIKSEESGRVIETAMDEGKSLKAGDLLVQLDTADVQLEIERIENDLKAAKDKLQVGSLFKIDLEGAKADLENAQRQFKLGSISESEMQKAQREVTSVEKKILLDESSMKQAVETLENALKARQRQLAKMRITVPFAGTISEVFVRKGDLVNDRSQIATVIATSRKVEARISEENFSGLKIGQSAIVTFLGYGSKTYPATVSKILPTADPETQRYIVYLDVNIEADKLVPGLTGDASITVAQRDAQTIIPRRALSGNYVLVVTEGVVEPRKVEVGYVDLDRAEIVKGLKQGDLVIVEQLDLFRPGQRVRVTQEQK